MPPVAARHAAAFRHAPADKRGHRALCLRRTTAREVRMSGSLFGTAVALAGIPIAGLPSAMILRLRGPLLAAGCWLLGAGFTALLMVIPGLLHISASRPVLAVEWGLVVG